MKRYKTKKMSQKIITVGQVNRQDNGYAALKGVEFLDLRKMVLDIVKKGVSERTESVSDEDIAKIYKQKLENHVFELNDNRKENLKVRVALGFVLELLDGQL
jgi:hypothetical protein